MKGEEHIEVRPIADEAAEVIQAYDRASQLDSTDAQMHFNYGVAFMELGTGLESHAIEAFEAAVRLRSSWSAALIQLGFAYASANRREEAVESYKQALRLHPENIDTLAALAHASLLLGRYEEAARTALRMIEIAPLASVSHLILGVAQLLQCQYADADESLRRAVSLEADLDEACYVIGLAALALGNDSVVQLQHERLTDLNWRLVGKLMSIWDKRRFDNE